FFIFFFQAEDGIRDLIVTGVQTCALPISLLRFDELSGHEHKYDGVRCAQFGLGQGARRAHTPQWVCNRRATQPQAEFGATLPAAVLFRPDFVARSLQIHFGICASLAPRLAKKSLAANVIVFVLMTT